MWDVVLFEFFVGRRNSEPALLLQIIGKVIKVILSQKPWTLAWCIDFASWQCFWIWHARQPEVYGQNSITQLEIHSPLWIRLFPNLHPALEGHRFSDIIHIHRYAVIILRNMQEGFQQCVLEWKHRKTKCIAGRWDHPECARKYWPVIN